MAVHITPDNKTVSRRFWFVPLMAAPMPHFAHDRGQKIQGVSHNQAERRKGIIPSGFPAIDPGAGSSLMEPAGQGVAGGWRAAATLAPLNVMSTAHHDNKKL